MYKEKVAGLFFFYLRGIACVAIIRMHEQPVHFFFFFNVAKTSILTLCAYLTTKTSRFLNRIFPKKSTQTVFESVHAAKAKRNVGLYKRKFPASHCAKLPFALPEAAAALFAKSFRPPRRFGEDIGAQLANTRPNVPRARNKKKTRGEKNYRERKEW